ncbi:TonB-dependent receptor [Kordiimonas pumila]|uniref:TonB-dependent receptor n=1 Tax=Kordiimonas pumila TaxID=2161677 RepID=A0ABV7D586_9PROT|nr:TonB-dependent receptor [Kordiimonas pumila]
MAINRSYFLSSMSIVLGSMIYVAPASAQEEQSEFKLEEIIVTARRRSENIQDTPVAITAFSGTGLKDRQINSIDGIADFTPGLTINSSSAFSGSSQSVSVFMRGIGQTDFTLNTDPGVGIYVDGVYISRSVGALLDLVDIDRLEVLHGPQGTLFGRNSVGGAISITTSRPADEAGGKVFATVGSDNWYIVGGTVDLPVSDTFKTKFTVQTHQRDGYVIRASDDLDLGDKDNLSARASAVWNPTEKFELFFTADYTRSRENGVPLVLDGVDPGAAFPAAHNLMVAPQLNPALQAFPNGCLDPAGAAVGGEACYNSQWISDDPNVTYGTYDVYSNVDVWGLSATMSYQVSDTFEIKSITAYRDLDSEFARDGDGSPLQINATEDVFTYRQWSEELQFLGTAMDGRLNYIVGGFFFDEKGQNPNIVDFGFARFLSGGDIHNTSLAGFGQVTYELTDRVSLTGGIRYTDETKRFTPNQYIISTYTVPFFPPFLQFQPGDVLTTTDQQEAKANEWTPHVNLSFRPNDDAMVYASYSRGFKSGGFTQRIFPAIATPPSFEPETVDVVEGGFKLDTFDRRLRLNGSAYYTWYNDLQVTVPVGVAPTTQNAAKARIKGFELEATAVPVDNLLVSFAAGYTDAYYLELDGRVSPTITLDNNFPGTSKWTLNSSVSYDMAVGSDMILTPRVDWSYRSSYFFDAENLVGQEGYHLVNASLTLENETGGWSVSVFGKNIGGTDYYIHGEQIMDPAGFRMLSPSRGSEWGIRLEKSF